MRTVAVIATLLFVSSAWAQNATAQMEPPAIRAALDVVGLQPGETLYDLGCGEGRVLIEAGKYGASVLGIEIEPQIYRRCQSAVKAAGIASWKIINDDTTRYSLAKADVVTVYLYDDVLRAIQWHSLKPGARVVSYCHDVPGLATKAYRCRIDGTEHVYYIYTE